MKAQKLHPLHLYQWKQDTVFRDIGPQQQREQQQELQQSATATARATVAVAIRHSNSENINKSYSDLPQQRNSRSSDPAQRQREQQQELQRSATATARATAAAAIHHSNSNSNSNSGNSKNDNSKSGNGNGKSGNNKRTVATSGSIKSTSTIAASGMSEEEVRTPRATATASDNMDTKSTNRPHQWQPDVGNNENNHNKSSATPAMGFKATTKQFAARAMKQRAKRKHWRRSRQRMSSNFLKNAAPASMSHETYNHLSQIKPNKREMALRTVNKNEVEGKFMETSWDGKIIGDKEYLSIEAVSIDSFETLDSMDEKYIIAFDKSEPSFTKEELEEAAVHIVEEMQHSLTPVDKCVYLETTVMTEVVHQTTLNSIGHHATAFSIGKNYH
eukprot:jgi/Psemu1/15031/gm1.15031_g